MTFTMCIQKTVLFGVGGVLLVVGVIMASMWPFVFKSVLKSQLALTKGSKTFDMWVETPLPMYFDIYLFNWTNSHNVTAKPVLQEVGPYVFSEKHYKVDVGWNKDGSVTYKQKRKWIYHPELSNGSLSDNVTNLNVIAVTIGEIIKDYSMGVKVSILAALGIEGEQLIVTKNVSQLLFEGYDDPILNIGKIFKKYNISLPITFDKFGWFYQRNMSETVDGVFNMDTGLNDINKLGDAITWNGKKKMPFYDEPCNKVEGSLGELWSPSSSEKSSITLYAFDMCGSLPLQSSGLLSMYGLSGTKFSGGENVFDNGTKYPESGCYCDSKNRCQPSGLRNVSKCRGGAPVFISFPHFYLADHSYRDAVDGLNPDPTKHSFNIALEEKTGVPMLVEARLQINILTEQIPHMTSFYKVPHTYMPMIWFSQRAQMTQTMAQNIRPLSLLSSYGVWALVAVAIFGLLLVLSGVFLKLNNCWGTSQNVSLSQTLLTAEN